jgi:anti-sigma B factor antagonist
VTATSIEPPTGDLATITVTGTAPAFRIIAAGEIDASTAPALRDELTALLDDLAEDLTVDLEAVTFLDSAGLCVLAAAHRRAVEQGAGFRVVASGRAVVRPLQITGLWDLLAAQDGKAPARV